LLPGYQGITHVPEVGETISAGDEIQTGSEGQVVLKLDDGTLALIDSDSTFRLTMLEGTSVHPSTLFQTTKGKIFAFRLNGVTLPVDSSFKIETPNGTMAIRGSSMSVEFLPDTPSQTETSGTTILVCMTGTCISESTAGQAMELNGGQRVEIAPAGVIGSVAPLTTADSQQMNDSLQTIQEASGEKLSIDISYCNNEIGGEMEINVNLEYIAVTRPGCWATPNEAVAFESSVGVSLSVDGVSVPFVGNGPTAECTPGGVSTGTYNFAAYYQIGPFIAGDHKVEVVHSHETEGFTNNEVCLLHAH
jgi:hypothetical protein